MQLFDLFGNVSVNGVDSVNSKLNSIGDTLGNIGSKMMGFGSVLTAGVTLPIMSIGAKAVMLASDLSESANVINVTFGKNAGEVQKWSRTLLESYGMVELESQKYVGSMGAMLKSSGLSAEASTTMSEKLVELTGDMSSFYNLSHEETWEKIRSGISGETEPLKALGINMSVANLEAYALSEGIKKTWQQMTQAEQIQLRYNYLMKATADAQGDFSRTSQGFANQLRIIEGQFTTLGTSIGTILLPYITKAAQAISEVIGKFSSLDIGSQKVIIGFSLLAASIGPIILVFGGVVASISLAISVFGLLLSPINLVAGAITVLIGSACLGGLIALLSNIPTTDFAGLKNGFTSLKDKAMEVYGYFRDTWMPAIKYLLTDNPVELAKIKDDSFRTSIESLRTAIEDLTQDVKSKFGIMSDSFKSINKQDIEKLSTSLASMATSMVKITKATMDAISALKTFWELVTFQKTTGDVTGLKLPGITDMFKDLFVTKKITVDATIDTAPASTKIIQADTDMFTKSSSAINANKPIGIDATVNDIMAKNKADASNMQLKIKAGESIPNILKFWGVDASIADGSAIGKADSSNMQIKTKSIESIPSVLKFWDVGASVNDGAAKSRTDSSNQQIKAKANEGIPNVTKSFSLFANVDISSALSSIGSAFGRLMDKVGGYSSSIMANIRIPGFASGVTNFGGGYALVGERGPELVNLPKGSNVYDNQATMKMLKGSPSTTNNGFTMNGDIIIDGKTIKEFSNIVEFFNGVKNESIMRG